MWRLQLRTLSFRCKIASNLYWYHCIQASFMQSVPSLLCWCRSPFTIFKFSLDSCLKLEGPVFSLGTGSIPFLVTCTFFSFSYFLVFYFFCVFFFLFSFFLSFSFTSQKVSIYLKQKFRVYTCTCMQINDDTSCIVVGSSPSVLQQILLVS